MNRNQRRSQAKLSPREALAPKLEQAIRHHQNGQLVEAEALYRDILAVDARNADAWHLLGLLAHQAGQTDRAIELISKAIGLNGHVASYHSNLGLVLRVARRLEDTLAAFDAALRVDPRLVEGHTNRAMVLVDLGRPEEAVAACDAALRIRPQSVQAHTNRACALRDLHRQEEALAACDAALRINPNYVEAHVNRGNVLKDLGRQSDALAAYAEALRIHPGYANALINQASLFITLGQLDKALSSIEIVLRNEPGLAEAHVMHGNVLMAAGRTEEALVAFDASLAINPHSAEAHNATVFILNHLGADPEGPILAAARRFAAPYDHFLPPAPFANDLDPERRLRIGYVSGDFCRQPVGFFLESVLAAHAPGNVEIFAYSARAGEDDLTARLRASSHHWRSLVGVSDDDAAATIRADGIDVLIDLSGHTAYNRLPVFARKPAPVQVSWLGYFGTTGLPAMDYVLADRFVVPAGTEGAFVENIWWMPDSYLCFTPPDHDVAVLTDHDHPLTFGCFNNHTKTTPRTIALWAKVLHRVPDSRLLLKTFAFDDEGTRHRLFSDFATHGIPSERLIVEGRAPRVELLGSYNRVDIALDPMPYGGGTTTAEALWMGVPVVTMRGGSWVGRVSESILATVGLADLVADDEDGYLTIAETLSHDGELRSVLRERLRDMLLTSALCDATTFTHHLEAAYRSMWRLHCENQRTRP